MISPSTCGRIRATSSCSALALSSESISSSSASFSRAASWTARISGGKKGFSTSGTSMPITPVRPVASPRAARLGVYPSSRAVSRICSRTDCLTISGREKARETVEGETPRLSAIE